MNCWVRDSRVCINAPGQKDSVPCVRHLCHFYSKDSDAEMEGHAHFLGVFQLGNVLKEHIILLVCMLTRRSHKNTSFVLHKNDYAGALWLPEQIMKWKELHLSKNRDSLLPNLISLSMSSHLTGGSFTKQELWDGKHINTHPFTRLLCK